MNFEEFKKLILSHPEQLADRSAYTDLQKLTMELAEQSPNADDTKNIKLLLTELVSGNNLNEFSAEQTAGLTNFVNDSALGIYPNDDFLKKLKTFLANNLKGEGDTLKRAYLLKLITIINRNEYSPEQFEVSEERVAKKYPWFYADIIAQSENFDYLKDFILNLYQQSESKEKTFSEMMKHFDIWWRNQLLEKNLKTEDFVRQISNELNKMRIDSEYTNFLFQWANSNGFLKQEFKIAQMVNSVRPRLKESFEAAHVELVLASA